jgi:YebC/PmpR family DNA-binding regulatory protein
MSGHSKWHQIRRKKAVVDQQKSKLFGRFAREIIIAAREDSDPHRNATLREVITRARQANMPQVNIDRLLAKQDQTQLTEILYEGFAVGGVALLIVTLTDNPNRTVAELKTILKDHGASLGSMGSVRWKFQPAWHVATPVLNTAQAEAVGLLSIEAGVTDFWYDAPHLHLLSPPERRTAIMTLLQKQQLAVAESEIRYMVDVDQQVKLLPQLREPLAQLTAAILSHADVIEVYTDVRQ